MKKFLNNMVLTAMLVVGIAFALTGCSDASSEAPRAGVLYSIPDTKLVYDSESRVLYYHYSSSYMTPYYNEHGQLCRYVDGQIVPIK